MNAAKRRNEIVSSLAVRHMTTKELAIKFGVSVGTIKNDIQILSSGYPIYTRPGVAGGVFMGDSYHPHINSLTQRELETLKELYEKAEDRHKEVLAQILHKYGPYKLKL